MKSARLWLFVFAVVSASACSPSSDRVGVDSVEPAQGSAAGGEQVTVTGSGFEEGVTVTFGDRVAQVVSVDGSQIIVVTPTATAGLWDVTVENPSGESDTLEEGFEYLPLEARFSDASDFLPQDATDVAARGAAAVDLDGDNDLDLVQAVRSATNRVLINRQGVFTDETADWMPTSSNDTISVAVGDLNGDTVPDVVTANLTSGGQQNRIYLASTVGDTMFEDVTDQSIPPVRTRSTDIALGDLDGDGDLDMVVANWRTGDATAAARGLMVYINDGDAVFGDPLELFPNGDTGVFGVAVADFDGDSDQDIFASVDGSPCVLFLNDGNAGFGLAPVSWLPSFTVAGRLPAAGDVDGDGSVDLVVPSANSQDRLLLNDGEGRFWDATADLLPVDPNHTEHALLADVDLDGDLDLLLAKYGYERNAFYLNDGTGRMYDYTSRLPAGGEGTDAAFVTADFNGDGAPDIFLSIYRGLSLLFLQETADATGGPN
jgi:hypothetical protein